MTELSDTKTAQEANFQPADRYIFIHTFEIQFRLTKGREICWLHFFFVGTNFSSLEHFCSIVIWSFHFSTFHLFNCNLVFPLVSKSTFTGISDLAAREKIAHNLQTEQPEAINIHNAYYCYIFHRIFHKHCCQSQTILPSNKVGNVVHYEEHYLK